MISKRSFQTYKRWWVVSEPLDLYSTSQTDLGFSSLPKRKFDHQGCTYHAPFFAIEKNPAAGVWSLSQGSCNHWDCPRCGIIRAKQEYWRIVQGSEQIVSEGNELFFITITTRGAGLKVAEAEKNYLQWTNRLFTNLRQQAKRQGSYWCYVQVTERQDRRHPHSHILTTYEPMVKQGESYVSDLVEGCKWKWEQVNGQKIGYWDDCLRSDVLQSAVCSADLGEQYDVSRVREVSAVARYIGKYLFKQTFQTVWPEGWKRVRYSQNWPKTDSLPDTRAFVLLNKEDWFNLATVAEKVLTYDSEAHHIASNALWAYPVDVVLKTNDISKPD